MIKGKTKSGFTFEVNESCMKSWDFIRLGRTLRGKNEIRQVDAFVDFMYLLLGEEAMERLSEHLVTDDGIVPVEAVVETFKDIMAAVEVHESVKK